MGDKREREQALKNLIRPKMRWELEQIVAVIENRRGKLMVRWPGRRAAKGMH